MAYRSGFIRGGGASAHAGSARGAAIGLGAVIFGLGLATSLIVWRDEDIGREAQSTLSAHRLNLGVPEIASSRSSQRAAPALAATPWLDPRPTLARAVEGFTPPALRTSSFEETPTDVRRTQASSPLVAPRLPQLAKLPALPGAEAPPVAEVAQSTPLPPRRPVSLAFAKPEPEASTYSRSLAGEATARPRGQGRARRDIALRNAPQEPSFFERLFGRQETSVGPALAYAPMDRAARESVSFAPSLERGATQRASLTPRLPETRPSDPRPTLGGGRAIYDISARVVVLPDGTRLEAHSGLGQHRDVASSRHIRMKGVTPPHVYTLTEREALFHGVRAIRLNPVGGSGAIFGRAGLLAHTYMLGPNGDSNGCVSIRDYDAFLQAFLSGKIRQLVVVESMRDLPIQYAQR